LDKLFYGQIMTFHFRGIYKCGFVYSHTEGYKPVPLLNEVRTEHFTKITLDDWKKLHR